MGTHPDSFDTSKECGKENLKILLHGESLLVGRSEKAGLRLLHPTVSRSHAIIEKKGSVFLIRDLDSRYGTFVNGVRVSSKILVDDDLIRFGAFTYYRLIEGSLECVSAAFGCSLTFKNISVLKAGREIVSNASFGINSNSFVGILGPSGAGKSSLLSVMASYHIPQKGCVIFDKDRNLYANLDEYRAILGNVPQQDIVYSGLTAQENLTFAAKLKAEIGSDESLENRVNRVLAQVGLADHANKLFEKLSGGQQKRLSVALELLKRPRLLLLDEPTSGLDPAAEAGLMENLKVIASQGTTVVCTTHHMDNVKLFDSLIVIGVKDNIGKVAYVGGPDGFLESFACRNYADAFEKLRDGNFPECFSEVNSDDDLKQRSDFNEIPTKFGRIAKLIERPMDEKLGRQAAIVSNRNFKRIYRDRGLVTAMAAQSVFLGSLVAITQFDAINARLLNFFLCVVSIWLGLNNSARDLVRERKNYVRERLTGLSPEAYLTSKLFVYAGIGLLQIAVLLGVTLTFVILFGEKNGVLDDFYGKSWRPFLIIYAFFVLFLSYLCGLGLGLFSSVISKTEEAAVAVLPLLIMPQILISAVAFGCSATPWNESRPFKPMLISISDNAPPTSFIGRMMDNLSFLLYSRSASLALQSSNIEGFGRWIWLGDFCLLVLLMLVTWTILYFAFRLKEDSWPKLLGLG
jgi:ABC-type multidrug transport system ATPase subunit